MSKGRLNGALVEGRSRARKEIKEGHPLVINPVSKRRSTFRGISAYTYRSINKRDENYKGTYNNPALSFSLSPSDATLHHLRRRMCPKEDG